MLICKTNLRVAFENFSAHWDNRGNKPPVFYRIARALRTRAGTWQPRKLWRRVR